MNKILSNLLIRISLIMVCVFPFLIIILIARERFYFNKIGLFEIIYLSMYIMLFIVLYKYRNTNFTNVQFFILISIICIVGVAVRLISIFLFRTVPTSDFLSVYNASIDGRHSAWRYISNYPYLYYQAKALSPIFYVFGKSHIIGQLFNCVLSVITMVFLFFTGRLLFDNTIYAIIPSLFFAIDPTMSAYTGVLSGEHFAISSLAIFFCIFLFTSSKDNHDKPKIYLVYYGLSGFMLAVYNIFKPVAIVFIIAFLITTLVVDVLPKLHQRFCKSNIKRVVLGALIFAVVYSSTLSLSNFYFRAFSNFQNTQTSSIELLYYGLAFEGKGVWNRNVKNYVEELRIKHGNNNDAFNDELFNKLKSELTEHKTEYYNFFKNKVRTSWDPGIQYITWSLKERQAPQNGTLVDKNILSVIYSNLSVIHYVIISVCSIIGIVFSYKKPMEINKFVYTLYLVMLGVFIVFLFIEAQGRYKSVFHPAFVVIGSYGIMQLFNSINNKNSKVPEKCN